MPGRTFRNDTPDARHSPVFHQIEALAVDRGITLGDLMGTIETFIQRALRRRRAHPLPAVVLPVHRAVGRARVLVPVLHGAGCRVCSHTGWIELGGCGMVDPNVLTAVGIDPEEYSGFAFGFGIDRIAMMRYGIDDIQTFFDDDVRFLRAVLSRQATRCAPRFPGSATSPRSTPPRRRHRYRARPARARGRGDRAPGAEIGGVVVAQDRRGAAAPERRQAAARRRRRRRRRRPRRVRRAQRRRGHGRAVRARSAGTLPGGFDARASARSAASVDGMLCSARELGLGDDHAGILALDADAELGADVREVLGLDDVVFDLSITPNRPDAMGIVGVARELAAHFGLPFARARATTIATARSTLGDATVVVEAPDRCPRLVARVATVTMGESPEWMQRRLRLAGMRPISNVVDVTNYVMLERCRPLHAFDLGRLAGRGHRRAAARRRART